MSKAPLPGLLCAYCNALIDDFTAVEPGSLPSEGDFMMCVYCHNINIFVDKTTVRKATRKDYEEMPMAQMATAQWRIMTGDYGSGLHK